MVDTLHLIIMLSLFQQASPTFEDLFPRTPPPDIANVRKVSQSEGELKPCQALTVLFEVTLVEEALRTQWPKIARKASKLVRVNGHDYKNRLSAGPANDACEFELLWPNPIGRELPLKSAQIALISATCQFDLKERVCLFQEPGDYRVEFFFEDHTVVATVHTNIPTQEERQIIERLNTLPMLLLLLKPTDRQYATPENIKICEELLTIKSDYSEMLAMTAGVALRLRERRPMWTELTEEQKREELQKRYRLLEPVLKREQLTSRLEGLAAFELANVVTQLAHLVGESPKRVVYNDLQMRLFQKVADCPLIPQQQVMAKQIIQERIRQRE